MAAMPFPRVILRRKWRVARRQRWPVLALAPVAWLAIGVSAAFIALLPFRRLAPWLGENRGAVVIAPSASPAQVARAQIIANAIGIAARNAPFRSNCLPQAMAAIFLCRRGGLPYAMHLGAAIDDSTGTRALKAHAWVECGAVTVTGGADSPAHYRALACFTSPGPIVADAAA